MTDSARRDGNNTQVIPKLDVVVTALAAHTKACMVSLHDLETSFASFGSSSRFDDFQKALCDQRDRMLSYFIDCQAFGEDISKLKNAIVSGSVENLTKLLTTMSAKAAKLRDSTMQLISKGKAASKNTDTLRVSASDNKSVSEIKDALVATDSYLTTFQRFWESVSRQYKTYLTKSADGSPSITTAEIEEIAAEWMHYRDVIENSLEFVAMANISSCGVLDSLVDSATIGLHLIEPWREARTNHPVLEKHIAAIQKNGVDYCNAINKSIKTAQDGYNISKDVIELYSSLPDSDPEDIKEYIEDIQSNAETAHNDSKDSLETFRSVYRNILEVTRNIPIEVSKAAQNLSKAQDEKGAFTVQLICGKDGSLREVEFETAMTELMQAVHDLATLNNAVTLFVGWWTSAETSLSRAKTDASTMDPTKRIGKIKIRAMEKAWGQINGDYLRYKTKIILLQDITHRTPRIRV